MNRQAIWSTQNMVAAMGAKPCRDVAIFGLSIDTRHLQTGDMFVALRDQRDGHMFLEAARAAGATAYLVETGNVYAQEFAASHPDAVMVEVSDVFAALYDLARAARARTHAKIIAVTGSAGKTGVKESLRAALAQSGKVHAAEKSFNNHIGVPLTLARMPRDVDYAVFEIGMSAAGEISPLAKLVRPDVAIITTISPAHIESLGSLSAIADAKAEIFDGLQPDGIAILPADNEQYPRLQMAALRQGYRVLSFGRDISASDMSAALLKLKLHSACSCIDANICGLRMTYKIAQPGEHHALNSLAVLAAVHVVGADLAVAGLELAQVEAMAGRGQRHHIAIQGREITLIDESYNANPASMRAALETLANAPLEGGGRHVAVLGDMAELGAQSDTLHRELASIINAREIDVVYTCGPHMRVLSGDIDGTKRARHADKPAALIPFLEQELRAHDVVMVKGSNASSMGLIVDHFTAYSHKPVQTEGVS